MGVFAKMMDGLTVEAATPKTVMIDATYPKVFHSAIALAATVLFWL